LIELIVVIVILGVLAATALPKFLDFKTDARIAALNQLAGTLRSTSDMVQAKCIVNGCMPFQQENVTLNGVTRFVWYGYPIENSRGSVWWGINDLIEYSGFDYTFSTGAYPRPAYFSPTGAPDAATCRVTYTYRESNTPPTITVLTSGC
jgi:MSHA pilin protein MshA